MEFIISVRRLRERDALCGCACDLRAGFMGFRERVDAVLK
jgi:hypothetical protein